MLGNKAFIFGTKEALLLDTLDLLQFIKQFTMQTTALISVTLTRRLNLLRFLRFSVYYAICNVNCCFEIFEIVTFNRTDKAFEVFEVFEGFPFTMQFTI